MYMASHFSHDKSEDHSIHKALASVYKQRTGGMNDQMVTGTSKNF